MEKRLLWKYTDTNRRSPALAAWFCLPLLLLLLLVCASALPTTAEAAETVYVSSSGNDESGDGTKGKPYATLAKAVTEAEDNATILCDERFDDESECAILGQKSDHYQR